MKRTNPAGEPSALQQLDQAFGLLARAGGSNLAGYLAATLPCVIVAGLAWADLSSSRVARVGAGSWATALLAAFLVMRVGQGWFMERLWLKLSNQVERAWQLRDWLRTAVLNAALQPAILMLQPIGILTAVGTPVVLALGQHACLASALPDARMRPALGSSLRFSFRSLDTLLTGSSLLAAGFLLLAVNLLLTAILAVHLPDMLAGIEFAEGFSATTLLSSTTFVWTFLCAYCVADPLLRAWFVQRHFFQSARGSGADILARISRLPPPPRRRFKLGLLAAVALLAWDGFVPSGHAEDPPPPALSADAFDKEAQDVLQRGEFRWKLPPRAEVQEPEAAERTIGWWENFKSFVKNLQRNIQRWLKPDSGRNIGPAVSLSGIVPLAKALLVILLVVALCLLVWLILRNRRLGTRRAAAAPVNATRAGPTSEDLKNPETTAADQPSDEWARLATDLMARGEWRLALRAWHLCGIAQLGEAGLLTVRRTRSDRDYERELARRGDPDSLKRFQIQRSLYEARWYGREQTDRTTAEQFSKPWVTR